MSAPRFIVAEVSKSWRNGQEVDPRGGLLSDRFEQVINFNDARGYSLRSWKVHQLMVGPDELNETIVAVFGYDLMKRDDKENPR